MNFEPDDLDWALGELLALIWRGKVIGIPAHLLEPELFYDCMSVINRQPAEVRLAVKKLFIKIEPVKVSQFPSHEVVRAE